VTTKEIALALQKAVGFEIDKRSIRNADEIGALGSYPIIVKLTPDVQAELTVEVLQEGQLPSAPVEKAPKAAEVEENADDNADDAEKA
jgi:hypothetical protein